MAAAARARSQGSDEPPDKDGGGEPTTKAEGTKPEGPEAPPNGDGLPVVSLSDLSPAERDEFMAQISRSPHDRVKELVPELTRDVSPVRAHVVLNELLSLVQPIAVARDLDRLKAMVPLFLLVNAPDLGTAWRAAAVLRSALSNNTELQQTFLERHGYMVIRQAFQRSRTLLQVAPNPKGPTKPNTGGHDGLRGKAGEAPSPGLSDDACEFISKTTHLLLVAARNYPPGVAKALELGLWQDLAALLLQAPEFGIQTALRSFAYELDTYATAMPPSTVVLVHRFLWPVVAAVLAQAADLGTLEATLSLLVALVQHKPFPDGPTETARQELVPQISRTVRSLVKDQGAVLRARIAAAATAAGVPTPTTDDLATAAASLAAALPKPTPSQNPSSTPS